MDNKILLLVLCIFLGAECKIPDYIQVCKASDPNINDCIIKSVYNIVPKLRTGIPELNVPTMEPLQINNSSLNTGSGGVHIGASLTNILIWNASTFEILDLEADIPKNRFEFTIIIRQLQLLGNYEINTKILALSLAGNGPFSFNTTDFRMKGILKGKKVVTNGVTHMKFDRIKVNILIGSSKVKLENLFNGDPILGKATNDVINDNADIFYDTLKPAIEDSLAESLTKTANKITEAFEYDELFPK